MSSYSLKSVSASTAFVFLSRDKIGHIVKKHDGSGWYGAITIGADKMEATCTTQRATFEELVRTANRIALCGVNDADKATAALDARNARVEKANAAARQEMLNSPIMEYMQKAFPEIDMRHRIAAQRTKSRKIIL